MSTKGIPQSAEHRANISKALMGRKMLHCRGENSSNWHGGKVVWLRRQVFERDHYTCSYCGIGDPDLMELDHILPQRRFPELKFEMRNLQTLCSNCHIKKTNEDRIKYPSPTNKGKKATPETIQKLRISHLGKTPWNKGLKGVMKAWNKGLKGSAKANKGSFQNGSTPWNKGKAISEEQNRKLQEGRRKYLLTRKLVHSPNPQ